jgi:hypothetical protein
VHLEGAVVEGRRRLGADPERDAARREQRREGERERDVELLPGDAVRRAESRAQVDASRARREEEREERCREERRSAEVVPAGDLAP